MHDPLAIVFALCAAAMFGLGNAMEHQVARSVPATSGVSVALLARLSRSPRWLLGIVNDVGAFGFQAAALAYGGLLVVQPLIVSGLLVALLLSARWSGRRLRPSEWSSALLLCTALVAFLAEASPTGGTPTAASSHWLRVVGPVMVGVVVLVSAGMRASGRVRAAMLGMAAGAMFGVTSALAKTFVEHIQHGVPYTARHWEVYALAILSVAGILLTQTAFQAGALGTSLPALEAAEPIVASLIGATVLHEQITGRTAFDNLAIGLSVVSIIVAVVVLGNEVGSRADDVGAGGKGDAVHPGRLGAVVA